MTENMIFSLSALAALVPASRFALRREGRRDAFFWLVLALAVAGPLAWAAAQMS